MVAKELTFLRASGRIGKTKYVRLEDDIYLVVLERRMSIDDWGDAIKAVVDEEGIIHSVSRFFLVWTYVAYPDRFLAGNFQAQRVSSRLTDDRISVSGLTQALCPEEVREAFREEIGEAS